jgi:uncharacterized protein (DUF1778 family)
MARPKKDYAALRTESIAFRLTLAQRLRIEEAAAIAGVSLAEYVRRQSLKGRIVVHEHRSLDPAAYDQLRRIGVNLNQLVRRTNRTGRAPPEVAGLCAAIEEILASELPWSRK